MRTHRPTRTKRIFRSAMRRRGKLVDGPSGQRVWDNTAEGPYEIVCPGCGDDPGRDWSEISAELRRIRGIYRTKEGAEAALLDHLGMQTR